MLLIGGAAGAASFRHVHDVAAAHGQPGWLAWADAVVLELASIAAGLELRRNRRWGKSVAFPATVLTVAVFLSLAAQVVEAEASVIGWVAAALPALGFLTMVKIALGRADPAPPGHTARPTPGEPGPRRIVDVAVPDTGEPVPGPPPRRSAGPGPGPGDHCAGPGRPDRRPHARHPRDTAVPQGTRPATTRGRAPPFQRHRVSTRACPPRRGHPTGPGPAEPVTAGGRLTDRQPVAPVRPRRPGQIDALSGSRPPDRT
ncbi:DUF2637 domain-containing protein [Micromonospora sp. NPDC004551]|uniref:DUF2637 domain-containing protein n=1 Tax=Micromonospora sp. NPDC004551 TaxID=3154284 RepID=UPI0033B8F0C8